MHSFAQFHKALILLIALAAGNGLAGPIELVNQTGLAAPLPLNGDSSGPIASAADGRYILFRSSASNLVAGDSNNVSDVFLLDTQTQAVERVNLGSNGEQADRYALGGGGGVSQDGRYVLFTSAATTFSALDTHEVTQVYRRDRQTGITTLISLDAGGSAGTSASVAYALSADGRYSLFATSAQNIIGSSAWQGVYQLYRHDAQTGTLELVSANTSGQPGGGSSHSAAMTPDGRHVLFYSSAADLIASDANGPNFDVFLRDLDSDSTVIASLAADATPMNIPLQDVSWPPFGSCSPATLSADGRYAVFAVGSVSGGYLREIHRYDRNSGTTLHISSTGSGLTPQAYNDCPTVSADGNRVAFGSWSSQPTAEIFLRDIAAGSLSRLISIPMPPPLPMQQFHSLALDDDGSSLLFGSSSLPQAQGRSHIFRLSGGGVPEQLTRPLTMLAPYANDHSGDGMNMSERAAGVSADGRYVVFASQASNLVTGDNNGVADVFLRDRINGSTERISRRSDNSESNCASRHASLSADARFVVFSSCGDLIAPASGGRQEVYRYDRANATLELVSRNHAGLRASAGSSDPHVSADGNIVAFTSGATDLLAGASSGQQIYVRDMTAAITALVSTTAAGQPGNDYSVRPYVSADGSTIAFTSRASNLSSGDANNRLDAFVFQRANAQVERMSLAADGNPAGGGGDAYGLSADGRLALFSSSDAGILPEASTLYRHVFLRDRNRSLTQLIAVPGDSNRQGSSPTISADGTRIAFISEYRSLQGPYDNQIGSRLYLHERLTSRYRVITPYLASDYGSTTLPLLSADGNTLSFSSSRGSLAADGNGPIFDVFLATDIADGLFADGFQR